MRNLISASTAAIFSVATIVMAAQSPSTTTSGQNPSTPPSGSQSPSSPSSQSAASPSSSSANQITVTGCLQGAEPGATGTSGTTDAANASGQSKFVLTGAKMSGAEAANTTTAPASAS